MPSFGKVPNLLGMDRIVSSFSGKVFVYLEFKEELLSFGKVFGLLRIGPNCLQFSWKKIPFAWNGHNCALLGKFIIWLSSDVRFIGRWR